MPDGFHSAWKKKSGTFGVAGTSLNHIFRRDDLAFVSLPQSAKTAFFSHLRFGSRTGRQVSVDPLTIAKGSATSSTPPRMCPAAMPRAACRTPEAALRVRA